MFDLKKPCVTCPFRKGQGSRFMLEPDRLEEIRRAPAFQCHKTVDYSHEPGTVGRAGSKPQQCAGLISVLVAEKEPNTIMRMGFTFGELDIARFPMPDAYASWADVLRAHGNRTHEQPEEATK